MRLALHRGSFQYNNVLV